MTQRDKDIDIEVDVLGMLAVVQEPESEGIAAALGDSQLESLLFEGDGPLFLLVWKIGILDFIQNGFQGTPIDDLKRVDDISL